MILHYVIPLSVNLSKTHNKTPKRFPLGAWYRFHLSDEYFCYKLMRTGNHAVRAIYVLSLTCTNLTASFKWPYCFSYTPWAILSVNTSFFKSCHIIYLPFLAALQPISPINVMTKPKMTISIVCVRLIVFKSVLPAAPMMMKSPTETMHWKNVFICVAPFFGYRR